MYAKKSMSLKVLHEARENLSMKCMKTSEVSKVVGCIYDVIKEIIHCVKGRVYMVLCSQQAHL